MTSDVYFYEFLVRGRAPGSQEPLAYHVILAQDSTDAFGNTSTSTSQALSPEKAEALGFGLPTIIASINTQTMAENASLTADVAVKASAIEALQSQLDALQAASQGG